jgi:hypothetical protein
MFKRIVHCINSLIPTIKDEELSLETKSIPEKIFYKIVDSIRSFFDSEIDREKGLYFDQFFVDASILFLFFWIMSLFFYVLPMIFLSTDPGKNSILGQMSAVVLLASFLWAGYVYIIQSFKNLTREKFLPVIEKNPQTRLDYSKMFGLFFEGTRVEWNTGFGLNIYIRSCLVGGLLISAICLMMKNPISELISGIFISHSLNALISLYLSIVAVSIVGIAIFIVFLTVFTVPIIFLLLLIAIRFLPLEINSFYDMGGTGQFGKIIINCIYLVSFALGTIPLIPLVTKLNLSSYHIPIPEGSIGNATTFIKEELVKSVNAIPVDSFSNYLGYIELFLIFILLAILVIFSLHYKIKRNKEETLSDIERIISDTDFTRPENKENNLYYLSLYEKISATNEWPIKKIFVIELIISGLPLFISLLF